MGVWCLVCRSLTGEIFFVTQDHLTNGNFPGLRGPADGQEPVQFDSESEAIACARETSVCRSLGFALVGLPSIPWSEVERIAR